MFIKRIFDIELIKTGIAYRIPLDLSATEYRVIQAAGETPGDNLTGGIYINQDVARSVADTPIGTTYEIKWEASYTYTGGNTAIVFGRTLTAVEALKPLDITVTCELDTDGTTHIWDVDVMPDLSADGVITAAKLASDVYASSAETIAETSTTKLIAPASLKDWWINKKNTVAQAINVAWTFAVQAVFSASPKISAVTAKKWLYLDGSQVVAGIDVYQNESMSVGFEIDEVGDVYYLVPYKFDGVTMSVSVTKNLAAVDGGDVKLTVPGVVVTNDMITIPASSVVGYTDSVSPAFDVAGAANTIIKVTTSKFTPGGRTKVDLIFKRILD